ncbi:hypothetical protein [Duncaniella dubosii]|uniref:hypothetical protein n=1 Tax=Duncaniella dubosii TaxID=2518971 RepID=UPI003F6821AE
MNDSIRFTSEAVCHRSMSAERERKKKRSRRQLRLLGIPPEIERGDAAVSHIGGTLQPHFRQLGLWFVKSCQYTFMSATPHGGGQTEFFSGNIAVAVVPRLDCFGQSIKGRFKEEAF